MLRSAAAFKGDQRRKRDHMEDNKMDATSRHGNRTGKTAAGKSRAKTAKTHPGTLI